MLLYVILTVIPGIISLVVFLVLNWSGPASDARNIQTGSFRNIILVNLAFAAFMAIFGLTGLIDGINDSIWWFIGLQLIFLGLGIFFAWLLRTRALGTFHKPATSDISLLVFDVLIAAAGFAIVFDHFQKNQLAIYYSLSVLVFLIPWFFMFTFDFFASIPPPIYKLWYYPLDMDEPDFDKIDLNNIYLLELEFSKSPLDESLKNYKARAPIDMIFGEWFRSFIKNYNYKFQEDPIEYLDGAKNPYGWIFFTKPTSIWENKKFIDPELSIKNNKLTEKTVIGAKRIEVRD